MKKTNKTTILKFNQKLPSNNDNENFYKYTLENYFIDSTSKVIKNI
jgi:hypothetical protein